MIDLLANRVSNSAPALAVPTAKIAKTAPASHLCVDARKRVRREREADAVGGCLQPTRLLVTTAISPARKLICPPGLVLSTSPATWVGTKRKGSLRRLLCFS